MTNLIRTTRGKVLLSTIIIFLSTISILTYTTNALTGQGLVSFTLQPGYLFIGATGSINVSAITSAGSTGYATGNFSANAFRVEDQKGEFSGYYTTIQATNLMGTGGNTINAANVLFKAGPTINLIAGSNNSYIKIGSGIESKTGAIANPMTYFYRKNTGENLLGKYGNTPYIEVIVPPGTPTGTYTGKIYYTLIINQ